MQRPQVMTSGWGWLAVLRIGLGLTMGAYALTYEAAAGHAGPGYLRPAALALAAVPLLLAAAQLTSGRRTSRAVAMAGFVADAMAVLGTLALYAFDPRRYLLALVVVVQAEGGVVLGIVGGVLAWGVTTAGYIAVEFISASESGMPPNVVELTLRAGVGLILALGGGYLTKELSGERTRRLVEREVEVRRIEEAEAKYRLLVEQIPVVTYVDAVDRNSSTLYMSPQVEGVVGYTPDEWTSDPELWSKLLHPDDRERILAENARTNATGEPFKEEYRLFHRDGRVVWVRDEAALITDEAGRPRFWQGVMVDITERKRAEEQVAFLAYHDKLTGLPNRVMFEQVLDLALARARRNDLALAVLYMDLDNFKLVNDSLGHAAGDRVLGQVAERLRSALRASDLLARQGGDEFLLLVTDIEGDPREAAEGVAASITEALEQPFEVHGAEFKIGASIGVSLFPRDAHDCDTLLRHADAAMYQGKRGGRGRVTFYAEEGRDALRRLSMATLLGKAVARDEFVLHYQPIVSLQDGSVDHVEALIRWYDPERGLVMPADFIPVAEETGLVEAIGDWVIEEVCDQLLAWREQDLHPSISFNVSPRQLRRGDLVAAVRDRLATAGVEASRLVMEVTETAAMQDAPERVEGVLGELAEMGFRIAIDDFGSGWSSLARLRALPVQMLKIDRSFLKDVPDDPVGCAFVRAVVEFGTSVGLTTVAEGVETEAQREFLLGAGCGCGQGFHLGRPLPAAEVARVLSRPGD